jgi:hypothetical protein
MAMSVTTFTAQRLAVTDFIFRGNRINFAAFRDILEGCKKAGMTVTFGTGFN